MPIYGIMGFASAHTAFPEAKQLALALGDNTTFGGVGKKRELVAHWGDPSFDVAFLLTHLVLKGVRRPEDRPALRAAASAFLDAYMSEAGTVAPADSDVVAELGCLLLARVDGKSPAEYLTGEITSGQVRVMARDLLLGRGRHLGPVLDHLLS